MVLRKKKSSKKMNNNSRRLILIILTTCTIGISLNFFSVQVRAWEIDSTGTAYYIYDGDTLNVTSVGRIRLADINVSEIDKSSIIYITCFHSGIRTSTIYKSSGTPFV
ncbi:hypothetical protein LCGC14_1052770 [marine sediment metagenome]|uniref:Uncharacterized protein n=1 Tax=marine sediment metagenome TaxID=412755 RepID=A0A0F9MNC7_9ZZZZ